MKVSVLKNAILLAACLAGFSACSSNGSGPDAQIVTPDENNPGAGATTGIDPSKDITPPTIVGTDVFTIAGRGTVYVISFDEAIDVDTASVTVKAAIGDDAEIPTKLGAGTDGKSLSVLGDFQKGVIYFANVDVTDLSGNALEPVDLKFQLPTADADGDGVEDAADKCPDTPKDWAVKGDGCLLTFTITPSPYFPVTLINPEYELALVASNPADGTQNVSVNGDLHVKFDTAVTAASLQTHFKLQVWGLFFFQDVPVKLEAGQSDGKEYWFKSVDPLKSNAIYRIVIEKGTQTDKGTSKEDIVIGFSTSQ